MLTAILRVVRVLVGQGISWALLTWGGIMIPALNITLGALINGIFKYIRDKYPTSKILEWLPV